MELHTGHCFANVEKKKMSKRNEETAALCLQLPEDDPEVAAKLQTNKPCAGSVQQPNMHKTQTHQHTYISRAN